MRWRLGGGGASSLVQCPVPLPVGPEPRRAAVAGVVPLASWRAGVLVPVRHRRGHDEVARSLGLSEVEYDYRDIVRRVPRGRVKIRCARAAYTLAGCGRESGCDVVNDWRGGRIA